MDTDNLLFGKVLKEIRENKQYTQQEISNHTMSRSNYSKMEKDVVNPNVEKYFSILNYLDMNHDEFAFILNGYKLDKKDTIIHLFKTMEQIPTFDYLETLITLSKEFLSEQEDHLISDIYYSCCSWYALLKDHDVKKARIYAEKIWNRLKELDKFYLSEYFLLNRILFYFELETTVSLVDKAIEELEKYAPLYEAGQLLSQLIINLSAVLITHKEYEKALSYTGKLLQDRKEKLDVLTLGSVYVYQAVCMERLNNPTEAQKCYDSASQLFQTINRIDLIDEINKAPYALFNPFIQVEIH
ncbi:hypothetical protein GCM10008932_15100 [Alkalibacterium iburiense]|uniref:HTH cro/C1-type domain-containing protein n=1 Tax=Alkalibacterium iburiense TaxID=290589 RepID=A0ABN0XH02_9LACT